MKEEEQSSLLGSGFDLVDSSGRGGEGGRRGLKMGTAVEKGRT